MPRISPLKGVYAEEDFRKEIRIRQGHYDLMSKQALAEHTGMPRTTLAKRLADPSGMTVEELRKLVNAIRPDPAVVLILLGYEKKDIKKMREAGI